MKKLLVVALLAITVVGMAEARRCGYRNNCCVEACPAQCEPACPRKSCLRGPCIVDCDTSCCEEAKPQLCALEPARVDLIKHVNTSISYSCAPLKECQVKPEQWQVDQLINDGSVPPDTKACP